MAYNFLFFCFPVLIQVPHSRPIRPTTTITRNSTPSTPTFYSSTPSPPVLPLFLPPEKRSCRRDESLRRIFCHVQRVHVHACNNQSGAGAAYLAQGLKGNSNLKSLAVRHVRLADPRALSALSSALSGHPALVTVSLGHCCLTGEQGGRLAASVIGAHAARREGMVWSTGLRQPPGMVENSAAAAPARIATAGCLTLDMSGNRLGDAGVHAVAKGLQSDTWLVRGGWVGGRGGARNRW